MSRGFAANTYSGTLCSGACASILVCLLILIVPLPAQAAGVEQHLFNPTLSLTGGCGTSKADEVPDPWCPGPPKPSAAFENPNIAIDSVGDMYVSSHDEAAGGRVDVFSPEGQFITELQVSGASALAVDPKGNLYVNQFVVGGLHRVTLFRPSGTYDPAAGEIAYGEPGEVIIENEEGAPGCSEKSAGERVALAIDPETEHLFVSPGGCVGEWSAAGDSPADGPELLDPTIGVGVFTDHTLFVAVDHAHSRLYVSEGGGNASQIQVFELAAPHHHLGTIDGHSTANGKFLSPFGRDTIAVDETSGHLIVSDLAATPVVYEFGMGLGANEELLETYKYSGFQAGGGLPLQIAVDNAETSPNQRSFFIPSKGTVDHTFAFKFSSVGAPEVESVSATAITETEAVLGSTINPNGAQTSYRVEYTSAPSGFNGATVAGEGTLPAGIAGVPVSVPVSGLAPGTTYRFRVVAENECDPGQPLCSDEEEGSFTTYPATQLGGPCENEALRSGPSAGLPDCRAYELVTPPDTNGRTPKGSGVVASFPTLHASPDGNRVSFRIEGGSIPGLGAAGSGDGDNYRSRRNPGSGWSTERAGPSGAEAPKPSSGSFSEDQEHAIWGENNAGEVPGGGFFRNPFLSYPDGHSEPVGRGSLGVDREVDVKLIGPNASHAIFDTLPGKAVKLEPDAPHAGTATIYDRTIDQATHEEVTHVISLLPGPGGEDITPAAGEDATFIGSSLDGTGVAFRIQGDGMLYLRQNDEKTYEVGEGLTYAGLAEGGGRLFYLKGGDLFAYDTATESATRFSQAGDVIPVNVSADGRTAYFISGKVLTANPNPNGAHPLLNEDNLYVSREGQIGFVGTVEEEDVEEALGNSGAGAGLGMWLLSLSSAPAIETSRTTPDGGALLFESRAPLAGYDPTGHKEIYRYDGASLACLSCNPTGAAASSNASLMYLRRAVGEPPLMRLNDRMLNLSADGRRAFFQSFEALVAADVDNKQDVYEWEAQGTGSCAKPGGCVYLISGPRSERDEYLFAASENGNDVFFLSGDLLSGQDTDTTTSIYDARVGGGFAEAPVGEPCQGEGCHPAPTPPPVLPTAATSFPTSGNLHPHHCPKGKRQVKRHGKTRCVAKKHHHHHHHKQGKRKGSK